MKKLVIVDGNNVIHRGYHRFKEMDLQTSGGFPTTAIFGYRNILRRMLREHNTEYFVVCFDTPEPTHRHLLYPDYKGGREKKHKLRQQYSYIHRITEYMGVQSFKSPRYEADDIIHTLVKRFKDEFDRIVIESTDKDLHQLICDNVTQQTSDRMIGIVELESKIGVPPEGIRMFISLVGDSPGTGDNIPGCRGIGKASAKQIASNDFTMDDLKESLEVEEFPQRVLNRLVEDWVNLELSYELVGLVDVPHILNSSINDLHLLGREEEKLKEIYNELEFKR